MLLEEYFSILYKYEVYGGIKMLTHVGTNAIETERLILRRFEYTDDDAMLQFH